MVNQDLKRGFEFADALFREVCRGSPSQINSLCRAEEEEKVCGSRSISKFISCLCHSRGQQKVHRATFIKPAGCPHPSGLEQREWKGGTGGWQFIGRIMAFFGGQDRE